MPPVVIGQRVGPAAGAPVRAVPVAAHVAHAAAAAPAEEASHRLNHRKLHITLAALAVDEVSNESVLAMACTRGTLIEWSIGDEVHPYPTDANLPRHKHFFLHYARAINHRDARYCQLFDMIGTGGRVLHPHIQAVGGKKEDRIRVITYTQKDRLYIASPNLLNFDAETAEVPAWALEMNQAKTIREGMQRLQERHAHIFYSQGAAGA